MECGTLCEGKIAPCNQQGVLPQLLIKDWSFCVSLISMSTVTYLKHLPLSSVLIKDWSQINPRQHVRNDHGVK